MTNKFIIEEPNDTIIIPFSQAKMVTFNKKHQNLVIRWGYREYQYYEGRLSSMTNSKEVLKQYKAFKKQGLNLIQRFVCFH